MQSVNFPTENFAKLLFAKLIVRIPSVGRWLREPTNNNSKFKNFHKNLQKKSNLMIYFKFQSISTYIYIKIALT